MKKAEVLVKEYVGKLSDEQVTFLHARLTQRYANDMSEALEMVSKTNEVDKWLSSASSAAEFYEMLDKLEQQLEKEVAKRDKAAV
jgi:hypothetical protein